MYLPQSFSGTTVKRTPPTRTISPRIDHLNHGHFGADVYDLLEEAFSRSDKEWLEKGFRAPSVTG
ncbi:MAG: hypothetical protein O7F69_12275, partial [Alphaproteobacteria bacterium]|nr:hypothetical protein [Alphaproteobacteria bacterium]